jgi:hypothetical protein
MPKTYALVLTLHGSSRCRRRSRGVLEPAFHVGPTGMLSASLALFRFHDAVGVDLAFEPSRERRTGSFPLRDSVIPAVQRVGIHQSWP